MTMMIMMMTMMKMMPTLSWRDGRSICSRETPVGPQSISTQTATALQHIEIQCKTLKYSKIKQITVKPSQLAYRRQQHCTAIHCNTAKCCIALYKQRCCTQTAKALHFSEIQCNTLKYSETRQNTVQCTDQHCTVYNRESISIKPTFRADTCVVQGTQIYLPCNCTLMTVHFTFQCSRCKKQG